VDLSRKFSEVLPQEREAFLRAKYRELKLIYQVDRLTDRHPSLPKLLRGAIELNCRVFKCEASAFLLTSASKRPDGGFFFTMASSTTQNDSLAQAARQVLQGFMQDPLSRPCNNDPSPDLRSQGIRSFLVFPMIIASQLEGAFVLLNRDKPFDDDDRYFLGVVSSQLDNGVVHGRFLEEHQKAVKSLKLRARELEVLYEMSLSLSLGYDFETLARKVVESVMGLVMVDRISVMMYDQAQDELKTTLVVGENQNVRLVRLGMGKGIAGLALLSRKPILAPLGSADDRFVPFEFPNFKARRIHALACVPLLAGDRPLGVMNFTCLTRKKTLTTKDLETLQVSSHLISLAMQRQQFYQMSIKDELTGLFTFRYFKERMEEESTRCRRYKGTFSMIIFDLDKFKSINDTYGHPFGNIVIQSVATILQNSVRLGIDMPARFGGEELALVLPHTESEGAMILAERIRVKVQELALTHEGHPVKVTISGGIACFPEHGDTPEKILEAADEALYRSKEEGRNRITLAHKAS
jgi:diguanylate cyclase (GGDEF)-like protein